VPLFIFGVGPDIAPLVRIAKEIGWHVTVVDARRIHTERRQFPAVDAVVETSLEQPLEPLAIDPHSVAVVMNHSYPVDRSILQALLECRPEFIGMLGPRVRTGRMLNELKIATVPDSLHAPVGLDIGADSPELIALSIVAEIQTALSKRTAKMLRTVAVEREALSPTPKPVALCA
jgi:xanthine dehydrogenase accessory factor